MEATKICGVFDRLVDMGLEPTTATVSVVLKALALNQGWAEAREVLQKLPERFGLRAERRLFEQLARACSRAGRHREAREFHSMAEAVSTSALAGRASVN